jgi:hypothetical protein
MTVSLVIILTFISVIPLWPPTFTWRFMVMSPLWNCHLKSKHSLTLLPGFDCCMFCVLPSAGNDDNRKIVKPQNVANLLNS